MSGKFLVGQAVAELIGMATMQPDPSLRLGAMTELRAWAEWALEEDRGEVGDAVRDALLGRSGWVRKAASVRGAEAEKATRDRTSPREARHRNASTKR